MVNGSLGTPTRLADGFGIQKWPYQAAPLGFTPKNWFPRACAD